MMITRRNEHDPPGLLVSVRNAAEALAALSGGADVIDVKEPDRGALGAADSATIAAVVGAVDGRAPVTAAAGELCELVGARPAAMPAGVSLCKMGLAGCRAIPDWESQWRDATGALRGADRLAGARPVAVAYADRQLADAPEPGRVLTAAVELGCPALLVDTWDKSTGMLFDHWPADSLAGFVQAARSRRLIVVLAGSLMGEGFAAAAHLGPDFVAVRTAACDAGRRGTVTRQRVAALKQTLAATNALPPPAATAKKFS